MPMKVNVTSGNKGSNPGGECLLYDSQGRQLFNAYFKYCHSARIGGKSSLMAKNQPIYEAITLQLAQKIGLRTPKFYVLLNEDKTVQFDGWKKFNLNDPSRRNDYFISKMMYRPKPNVNNHEGARKALEKDKVYLESLLVADVINKAQNYIYFPLNEGSDNGYIDYIDLGCSFVHAVDGTMTLSPKVRDGWNGDCSSKDIKRMKNRIRGKNIICAENTDVINLEELAAEIYTGDIPVLNPLGRKKIRELLCRDELDEIYTYILCGRSHGLKEFESRKLLI
jgi:hypothetical protein